MNEEEKSPIDRVKEGYIIPECCREGWDSCPHVIQKERKRTKNNVGL